MTTTVRGCDADELRAFYDSPLWRRMCASIRARAGGLDEQTIIQRCGCCLKISSLYRRRIMRGFMRSTGRERMRGTR